MSLWGRLFAATYDRVMAAPESAGLGRHRSALLGGARGRGLEIGAGTGANLRHYGPGVSEVVLLEPEEPMARRLEGKLGHQSLKTEVVRGRAEELPFGDGEFDFVVSTLVLCTVSDPSRALSEIRRVLRPGGSLIFLEHVRSEDPGLAAWQDRLHGIHKFTGHGCHCNRRTLASIEGSGLRVTALERDRLRRALPIVSPLIAGSAVNPTPTPGGVGS